MTQTRYYFYNLKLNSIFLLKLLCLCAAILLSTILFKNLFINKPELLLITERDIEILKEEKKSNPLVQRALSKVRISQIENFNYINNLNKYLKKLLTNNTPSNLQERILEKLIIEEEFFYDLNKNLKKISRQKIHNIPYSLLTNKMPSVIIGTKELISNHFDKLLNGEFLYKTHKTKDLSYTYSNNSNWLSTSNATFIKAALLSIIIELDPNFKSNLFSTNSNKFVQIFLV